VGERVEAMKKDICNCEQAVIGAELLKSWVELARNNAFGIDFFECEDDCDCIVCESENFLKEYPS